MNVTPFPTPPLPAPADVAAALAARRRAIRAEIAAEVERLVGWLDAIDGDPDLEAEEDADHDGREPFAPTLMGGSGA